MLLLRASNHSQTVHLSRKRQNYTNLKGVCFKPPQVIKLQLCKSALFAFLLDHFNGMSLFLGTELFSMRTSSSKILFSMSLKVFGEPNIGANLIENTSEVAILAQEVAPASLLQTLIFPCLPNLVMAGCGKGGSTFVVTFLN